jgi:hypothetical protein
MIAFITLLCIAACAKRDQAAQDTTKVGPAAPPPPANTTLADFAGKWHMAATPLAGKDTTTVR